MNNKDILLLTVFSYTTTKQNSNGYIPALSFFTFKDIFIKSELGSNTFCSKMLRRFADNNIILKDEKAKKWYLNPEYYDMKLLKFIMNYTKI